MDSNKASRFVVRNMIKSREMVILGIIIVAATVLSFVTKSFLSASNLTSVAMGFAADGFLALGMTFILISAQIDLSVGSVMGLTAVVIGRLYTLGVNIWIAAACGLAAAAICGMISGSLIARLRIVPFIITLGMQGIARGLCYVITSGAPISTTGEAVQPFRMLGNGVIGRLPVFVSLLFVVAIVCQLLLKKTKFFAKVYFVGSNEKAASLAGVGVVRTKIILFIISGCFAGLAGMLSLARFGVATPTLGLQAEGRAITAAVVGGTAMSGGEGSIIGTILGLIMIHIITNGLVLLQVSVYWQDFVSNLLLVLVIILDTVSKRRRGT